MDFFTSQDHARKKTKALVFYFIAAVVLMILALHTALIFALNTAGAANQVKSVTEMSGELSEPGYIPWWSPEILFCVAAVVLLVIFVGSTYKTIQLRGGGEVVASALGGRRIPATTDDPAERRLLNVVEEMALASGMAVPPVYVLQNEQSINAFAAGFSPDDAVIGVNKGTIDHLSRDELQGVIAHEFSHIMNGDMRLNIRLIGLLHGILLIALIGYYILRTMSYTGSRSRDSKGAGAAMLVVLAVGLSAVVIGYIGLLFGRLIKAGVSRQREFLADASAVQFTRNPLGIAGALKKIGGFHLGSRIKSPEAESASHMFFGSALGSWGIGALATHPPLAERVRRIDPQFNGVFEPVDAIPDRRVPKEEQKPRPAPRQRHGIPVLPGTERLPLDPLILLGTIGAPTAGHVQQAADTVAGWPAELREAVHDPFSARAAAFGLLLDPDEDIRLHQLQLITELEGDPTRLETEKLVLLIGREDRTARLPLLGVIQGTLGGLSLEQYRRFKETVRRIIAADRKISLFEFVLQRMLLDHLDRHFRERKPDAIRYHAVNALMPEAVLLLSALAHVGHRDVDGARLAFDKALATLGGNAGETSLLAANQCSLKALDEALRKFAQSSMPIRRRLLVAAATAVAVDGKVTVGEAELFRAISDSIDCPVPPIMASAPAAQSQAS